MSGTFYGVGLGPGDPELITRKAARIIADADVVAYHAGVNKNSYARTIAADLIRNGVIEEELRYPVTTGVTDHPGGYAGALADFYEASASRLAAHLSAGRTVALLTEGDPLFYGSFMYMHDRLSTRFDTEIIPGVPAFSAATAAIGMPLVRQTDVLTVLPGTLPEHELAMRLADTDGAIIMKLGRTFPAVHRALVAAGRLEHAYYVERASHPQQRWLPVTAMAETDDVPYLSLIVVDGDSRNGQRSRKPEDRAAAKVEPVSEPAELLVIGLGPGPEDWLTAEAAAALATVDHVVGYGPYLARVPQRAGLQRHSSGNTVELDRARLALDLAARGEKVAVVSGGDAGVFGMASTVFEAMSEAADGERYQQVSVRVLPGVSAVQAVAAAAGAAIGADFAVLSLSDRLKPWPVIESRLRAIADADLVLAIYNPASRARPDQIALARKVLLEHRDGSTVVVVGRDVGRESESLTVTTLGELDTDAIDMKCLVLVGSSSTRVTGGRVWTPRWVR
ncbi:precorrin-3B C(17)-methyltransferase [Mycolicibacter senuensis]|uniref:Precorrin-3B C(17)-methyltransferase n=1 Tax=Mycolicibacter senuensis TaxID=386913 RepID=A0A7I9XGD0_9MYCO|nr:precorrin-3B C(17)-methyltransferase [Mycolicibacter senuensis]ORW64802.1 ATP-binding protein [Mycolicibacter senuensis]GFG68427.1 precorrin-3B C(17)-methyltransferase [Mycolicibacter senuensis]